MKNSNALAILQTVVHFIEDEAEDNSHLYKTTKEEYNRGYVNGLLAVKREIMRLDRNF